MGSELKLLRRAPQRHFATVLFCDIRGFSALFNERDPMDALVFANAVLADLGAVVESSGGYIDKFTGDGFLAHFGVLSDQEKHFEEACWCAVRIREALIKINYGRHIENQPIVSVGIGIHCGPVVSGVVQTINKSEFTIFGDVVNMAARIESLTNSFSIDCLVSEDVYAHCKDKFHFQPMPVRTLKGIRKPQVSYWLLPTNIFVGNTF